MVLGYPYFRKPPNGDSNGKIMHEYCEFCPSPCVFHPRLSCREQPRSVWIGGRSEGRNVCFLLEHHTLVEALMVLLCSVFTKSWNLAKSKKKKNITANLPPSKESSFSRNVFANHLETSKQIPRSQSPNARRSDTHRASRIAYEGAHGHGMSMVFLADFTPCPLKNRHPLHQLAEICRGLWFHRSLPGLWARSNRCAAGCEISETIGKSQIQVIGQAFRSMNIRIIYIYICIHFICIDSRYVINYPNLNLP